MNTEHESTDRQMAIQVDRLVCGELDESARQTLLAWLEADPVRWRVCGVAFLEAQIWSQVLENEPRLDAPAATIARASAGLVTPQPEVGRRALWRQATIAAAIVIAFGLGLAYRDFSAPRPPAAETAAGGGPSIAHTTSTHSTSAHSISADPDRADPNEADRALATSPSSVPSKQDPVLASFNVETGSGSGRLTPIQIPVVPAANDASREREHSEIPEYVRQQWERRGYKVSLEKRFVFAKLADGQQVVVPVEQVRINPIPIQIN